MHCGKMELCYLAQTLSLLGESNLGVIENSLMSQIKKTPPLTSHFMNESSLKPTKIFNLNLLKFDCQNLPFRRSLAS